jgi:hypothetical protein
MSTTTTEPERFNVLIDLELGDSSKALKVDQLVQIRHYNQLRSKIATHLSTLPPAEWVNQIEQPYGSGWSHFIDGSRGAGKSTFLSSAKGALERDSELKSRLAFIDVIDPSRIEGSEIVLLVILQRLSKQVDVALKGQRQTQDEELRGAWRRAFKGVAGGLSLFVKDHHPLNDLDPELFLDWGLERTGDSTNLRKKLHHLFDTACHILGVPALMLGFDDADTDSTHAIKLLECIRKYLDTPRIMVLVTGDMELYAMLVRQHFAETVVGRRSAAYDLLRSSEPGDRSSQALRMMDHLEEQYLLKLFPIRRRMQLQPLWNVTNRDDCQVTHSEWGAPSIPVRDVVKAIVRRGLRVKNKSDENLYAEFLLRQPLRSVLQLMARCAPHLGGLLSANLDSVSWSPKLATALSQSLQALALTSLYKFSVDTDAIAAGDLPALTQAIFDLSLEDGDLDTAPYLRPMSAKQDIKTVFAALAAEVPNLCAKQPGSTLRYLLRGPGSVSLYALVRDHFSVKDPSPSRDRAYQFKSYMGVGRNEDSLDWARRATAVSALPYPVNERSRCVLAGIVGLRLGKKWRTDELVARIAIQRAVDDDAIHCLPVFAMGMVNVVSNNGLRTYGSIFVLVGLIERLLSANPLNRVEARRIFSSGYPSLTISAPSGLAQGRTESADEGDETESSPKAKTETPKQIQLWISVENWLESIADLSEHILPSSIFVGKVWTRLFFSLENAADALKSSADFAEIMEIFALCVINSFLVEESEHHLLGASTASTANLSIDRKNPLTNASWFVEKLKTVKPERGEFPLTSIMATCPLLLGLLNAKEDYVDALMPLFPSLTSEQAIKDLLCPPALTALMKKVAVTGGKTPIANAPPGEEGPAKDSTAGNTKRRKTKNENDGDVAIEDK